MLGGQILTVVRERHPGLPLEQVGHRQIRRIPAVRVRHGEVGCGFHIREQRVQGHALPSRSKLGPASHAVQVHRDLLRR